MVKNLAKYIIILLLISFCGQNQNDAELTNNEANAPIEETTTTTNSNDTTSTTTSTTVPECIEDINSDIDFANIVNVQKFLNRYGFNAGDEDGFLGQQTVNAIREFQSFAGLTPDGDIGPITVNKMKNWTGCEDRERSISVNSTTTTVPTDSTTTTVPTDSTTTTVPTDSTTTTVSSANSYSAEHNYGYIPSISLTSNEVITLFKGVNDSSSICGTPYINNLNAGISNFYSNGLVPENIKSNNISFSQSTFTTQIVEESNTNIKVQIIGNESENYRFYFIAPFSSNITSLKPNSISTSSNLTEAVFNLDSFAPGVWFYSFAENGDGTLVKATGNREFNVGNITSQQSSANTGIEKIIVTTIDNSNNKFKNVTGGQAFSTTNNINIVYITEDILDNRENTIEVIDIQDETIKLSNENQASISEILLIGTELMKITSKDGQVFSVQRGFLNTEIKSYPVGTSVKAVKNLNQDTKISSFAYAIFRNEYGMRFQVPLGEELASKEFSFNQCNYDRYSLESIVTFSWRSSGSSTVKTFTLEDKINPLLDKVFVVNSNGQTYTPPTINGSDQVSGDFLNDGPRDLIVSQGEKIVFNFGGIIDGSSKTQFVKIKLKLMPDSSSTKKSKSKEIYMTLDNDSYQINLNIEKVVSNESKILNEWESGYKYIFESITLFDLSTGVEIKNNGKIKYDYKSAEGSHDAYYLDQFSFIIKNN